MQRQMCRIGEVAAKLGLSVRTVRQCEELGLVVPSRRSPGGFRLYLDEDAQRLGLVKDMRLLMFTVEEMREVLVLWGQLVPDAAEEPRCSALEGLERYAVAAEERCAELRAQLAAARETVRQLELEVSGRLSSGMVGR